MTRIVDAVLAAVLLLGCTTVVAESDPARAAHVESFTGEVLIETRGSSVVILIDANKGNRDGFVDQWFTLQSEVPPPALSEHSSAAQIVLGEGYVRIVAPERRMAYDFVIGESSPASDLPEGFRSTRVEGFGLAHHRWQTSIRIPNIRRDGITTYDCEGCEVVFPCDGCDGTESGASVSCQAGGVGSTSCSVTSGSLSCTANCGPRYYACCKYTAYAVSCKCYPNS